MTRLRERAEQLWYVINGKDYGLALHKGEVDAIHAALEQVVEDCCNDVCRYCAKGIPVLTEWEGNDGFWHDLGDFEGHNICFATAIRQQGAR